MPTDYSHFFRTFMGLPPSKDDKPLCGADLPDSWDFAVLNRPPCPDCEARTALLEYRHALHCTLNEKLGDDSPVAMRIMRRFREAFPPDVRGNEAAWEMVWVAIAKEEIEKG